MEPDLRRYPASRPPVRPGACHAGGRSPRHRRFRCLARLRRSSRLASEPAGGWRRSDALAGAGLPGWDAAARRAGSGPPGIQSRPAPPAAGRQDRRLHPPSGQTRLTDQVRTVSRGERQRWTTVSRAPGGASPRGQPSPLELAASAGMPPPIGRAAGRATTLLGDRGAPQGPVLGCSVGRVAARIDRFPLPGAGPRAVRWRRLSRTGGRRAGAACRARRTDASARRVVRLRSGRCGSRRSCSSGQSVADP
jgi:hypothetical protein